MFYKLEKKSPTGQKAKKVIVDGHKMHHEVCLEIMEELGGKAYAKSRAHSVEPGSSRIDFCIFGQISGLVFDEVPDGWTIPDKNGVSRPKRLKKNKDVVRKLWDVPVLLESDFCEMFFSWNKQDVNLMTWTPSFDDTEGDYYILSVPESIAGDVSPNKDVIEINFSEFSELKKDEQ